MPPAGEAGRNKGAGCPRTQKNLARPARLAREHAKAFAAVNRERVKVQQGLSKIREEEYSSCRYAFYAERTQSHDEGT
jgi:hypothetical protein